MSISSSNYAEHANSVKNDWVELLRYCAKVTSEESVWKDTKHEIEPEQDPMRLRESLNRIEIVLDLMKHYHFSE